MQNSTRRGTTSSRQTTCRRYPEGIILIFFHFSYTYSIIHQRYPWSCRISSPHRCRKDSVCFGWTRTRISPAKRICRTQCSTSAALRWPHLWSIWFARRGLSFFGRWSRVIRLLIERFNFRSVQSGRIPLVFAGSTVSPKSYPSASYWNLN